MNEKKANYDLLSVVMVYLGHAEDEQESNVLNLLNTLLSEEVRATEKIDFLSTEFEIPATEEFTNEVEIMCNLSQGVEQRGIEKGIQKGIQKVIQKAIDIMRDLDIDDDIITEKMEEKFELSNEELQQFL